MTPWECDGCHAIVEIAEDEKPLFDHMDGCRACFGFWQVGTEHWARWKAGEVDGAAIVVAAIMRLAGEHPGLFPELFN